MSIVKKDSWDKTIPWIDRADSDIDGYMEMVSEQYNFDLRQKLIDWKNQGYVVFEGVVDKKLIDDLLSDIKHLKTHHKDYELSVELRGTAKPIGEYNREELDYDGIKFNNMQTISKAAARLSLTREVVIFLQHVFQSPACAMQSLTFYRGSQQPIHIDYPYVRCQTKLAHVAASWIPLEDINLASGPLAYYPGSHKTDVSGFFDWGQGSILYEADSTRTPMDFVQYLSNRMQQNGIQPRIFSPKKGDVLIWHGNLSHEGTKIQNPELTRKSYVTHYTSLEAYPPLHMKPDALQKGNYISEHGGYVFEFPWIKNANKLPSWYY